MTIDKLINKYDGYLTNVNRESVAHKLALAALQAHKAGYQMYTYDYSERDWLPAECELTRLLEELK
jgi:hypothetical protein